MKKKIIMAAALMLMPSFVLGSAMELEQYIKNFDYQSRTEMKAASKQVIDWLEDGKAVLVYLRSKRIQARYLTDGLIALAENLRGDSARYLMDLLH